MSSRIVCTVCGRSRLAKFFRQGYADTCTGCIEPVACTRCGCLRVPWVIGLDGICDPCKVLDDNRGKKYLKSGGKKFRKADILDLLESQGKRCALTGAELRPDNAVLDHIVSIKNGGEHGIDNLQVVTSQANRAKNTMSNDDFIELCLEVVAHHGLADL